jgi:VIT1/CCC1 family predicted Fe2+/Mn2+ transporter
MPETSVPTTPLPSTDPAAPDRPEPLSATHLNFLRAGVLGANDGIVSIAATVLGVVAATKSITAILIAAVAALVAGAMSMAAGEYVSVSSQRDAELVARDHARSDGVDEATIQAEMHLTNPTHAAVASFFAFLAGGLVPVLVVLAPWWGDRRDVATLLAVLIALAVTGWQSARFAGAPVGPAVRRVMIGGLVAMAVTYGIGSLVGLAI